MTGKGLLMPSTATVTMTSEAAYALARECKEALWGIETMGGQKEGGSNAT